VGPGRTATAAARSTGDRAQGQEQRLVSLAIGPWRHSGANHYGYDLGALIFTGDTAREWRVKWVKPFFDHWLKGGPDPKTPPC
jgi:predicted acyl esterase